MVQVKTFFDKDTFTLTHVVYDQVSRDAIVIDPVLDLDTLAWSTQTHSLEIVDDFLQKEQLTLHYVIDTHVHADHLSGMQYLKAKYGAPLVINSAITRVQKTFSKIFHLADFPVDGSQFDMLVDDGDILSAGTLIIHVLHTPGHTPACTSYRIDDMVFTGDTLFVPDIGTGRCDFPEGSAQDLYHSVMQKIYTLSDSTRIFPGHDYPGQRELVTETTVGKSKAENVDLPASRSEEDYVAFMLRRDGKLAPPRLIYPSVQINIAAGNLPNKENNGMSYLKIPISSRD